MQAQELAELLDKVESPETVTVDHYHDGAHFPERLTVVAVEIGPFDDRGDRYDHETIEEFGGDPPVRVRVEFDHWSGEVGVYDLDEYLDVYRSCPA